MNKLNNDKFNKRYHTIIALILLVLPVFGVNNDTIEVFTKINNQHVNESSDLIRINKLRSTASVVSITGETIQKTPVANLTNSLYGILPGLHVDQGSGEPGYDGAWMTIRGIGSYNYGSLAVYVDGFQTNMSYFQYLSPAEIESVSILKDAASLATFGMKGANGVLWVTTKRGEAGKSKIKIQLRQGIQQPLQITKPLNAADFANLYNEAASNDNNRIWSPVYNEQQINDYNTGTGTNTDWYKHVIKKSTPFSSADVSFIGGEDAAKYFIMVNFTKTQGLYNTKTDYTHSNAQLEQINIRSNFDFKILDYFEGKVDLGGRIEGRRYPGYSARNLWNDLERYPNNIYPIKNENGTWTGTNTYPNNPLASISELGYFSTRDRNLQANFELKEKLDFITPGLYLSESVSINNWTRGSYNVTKNYPRFIGTQQQTTDKNTNYSVQDDWGTNQWNWNQFKTILGYDNNFGKNKFSTAVSYLQYVYNVDANQNGTAGINTKYAFQNIAGKVNYTFDNTYIVEFGFAVSGSDNYRKGNRFGFYPTVSGAWIMSNEDFLKDINAIDLLKLRTSIGQTGYDGFNGPRYLYQTYYTWSGNYLTGNGTPLYNSGMVPVFNPNPDIFAEKSTKINLGVDAQLFNNLHVTADGFVDKRSGIVSQEFTLSDVYGLDAPYKNVGKVTTSGLELIIQYINKVGNLNYSITGNVTYIKDKIDYMAELTPSSPFAWKTGNSIGTQFGYIYEGFYDISDFNADGSLKDALPTPSFGSVQPGDVKYSNLNNDNLIDTRDITKIGKPEYPNWMFGITMEVNWKEFDFRVLFQGVASREINILQNARNKVVAFENNGNAYSISKGRWAYYPENNIDTRSTATYPRLSTMGNNNNYLASTLWIKNGDFLRLRNFELGYNFPKEILSKLKFTDARLSLSAVNLFTLSSLINEFDIDPESESGYPALKSFNMALTVNF